MILHDFNCFCMLNDIGCAVQVARILTLSGSGYIKLLTTRVSNWSINFNYIFIQPTPVVWHFIYNEYETWNFLPFELSSSLTYSSFPLEHTLIRPVQSGWSNFQSAALIKKWKKCSALKKYSCQNLASYSYYSIAHDLNNWQYIIWVF